ncbi:hypothetical protein HPB50_000841 [Hyalomma asiaticum]|uniref:Uncharacterized protein n=1 Tax=Hyalomma asiaticum TaxID=266040 RepID=A0ACB7RZG5_HYAAI|nr:hypothetical protein HPB50_000841 [Hyalomma asiaticum]
MPKDGFDPLETPPWPLGSRQTRKCPSRPCLTPSGETSSFTTSSLSSRVRRPDSKTRPQKKPTRDGFSRLRQRDVPPLHPGTVNKCPKWSRGGIGGSSELYRGPRFPAVERHNWFASATGRGVPMDDGERQLITATPHDACPVKAPRKRITSSASAGTCARSSHARL